MSFQFASQHDQDTYITLNSLVKSNNGAFKSAKQMMFLTRKLNTDQITPESAKAYFNVDVAEGQFMVRVEAWTSWANYGVRGQRPVTWAFVLDNGGVVRMYKIRYQGDMRSGTAPDPKKTEILWSRVGEVLAPVVEEAATQEQEPKVSIHLGVLGERIMVEGVIKNVRQFERAKFHYYDSGIGYVTQIDVGGAVVVYFGKLDGFNTGDSISLVATVKTHDEFRGVKQTVIGRPKVVTA
jgi:hypothetical protein